MPKGSTVIFLAEVTDREATIKADIKKFNKIYNTNLEEDYDISFACYQSAYKWENKHFNLVIADEIHNSLTAQYYKFYLLNTFDAIVGLSATIDRESIIDENAKVNPELNKGDLIDRLAPVVYSITLEEAVDDDLVSDFEVLVLNSVLEGEEKKIYDSITRQIEKCTNAYKFRALTRKRAWTMYNITSKIHICKALVDRLTKNFKVILFGNSLDSLLDITPYTVSSRYNKKENDEIKKKFDEGEINVIASFKKLKQGANLEGANIAILHSYYSVSLDYIQRVGRILRKGKNNYRAVIILRNRWTVEDRWLHKMIKDSPKEIINFDTVDELLKYIDERTNVDDLQNISR